MIIRVRLLLCALLVCVLLYPFDAWSQRAQLLNGNRTHAGATNYGLTTGSTTAYVLTLNAPIPGYVDGTCFLLRIHVTNTGDATLNVNGKGATPMRKWSGGTAVALAPGDLGAGQDVIACYDSTTGPRMQVLSLGGGGGTGGGVIVMDLDGVPSGTFGTLKFSNGSVADNGDGSVTVTTGAGAGGDASTNTSVSVDNELALFAGTGGKTFKRATTDGVLFGTAGRLSAAVPGTHYVVPSADINSSSFVVATHLAAPLPVAQGGTGLASGTSGGINYYSAAGTLAPSGVLAANSPVLGGGAGGAPTTGTRSGTTTEFGTISGTKTTGKQLAFDASGNVVASATDIGGSGGVGSLYQVNPQTSTYQVLPADFSGRKTLMVASGTFTMTLVANTQQPLNGEAIRVINYGSGTVTIARNNQNINGSTNNLTLPAATQAVVHTAWIVSDGTNYFAETHSSNPMTTPGDLVYAGTNGLPTRLPAGTGLLRAGNPPTYGELSGDCTSTAGNVVTCTRLNNQIPFTTNPKTAAYPVVAADFDGYKTINVASGSFTITLVASTSQPTAGKFIRVLNYGTGTVTIMRSGQTINGGTADLVLPPASATLPTSAFILSDGVNYLADVNNVFSGASGNLAAYTATNILGDSGVALSNLAIKTPASRQVLNNTQVAETTCTLALDGGNNVAINIDNCSDFILLNPGANFTLSNPTATGLNPRDNQEFTIRILSNTARTITYGNKYAALSTLPLPTTTVGDSVTYNRMKFKYILFADKYDMVAALPAPAGSGAGHIIKDEGTSLPSQPNLNFTGTGIACANNAGTNSIDCNVNTIAGTGTVQLPITGVHLLGTTPAMIDSSLNNRALVFDSTANQCVIWDFTIPADYLGSPVWRWWYTKESDTTSGNTVRFDVSIMKLLSTVTIETDSYDTLVNCTDTTTPTAVNVLDSETGLTCALATMDGAVVNNAIKLRVCHNNADTVTGNIRLLRSRFEYAR